MDVTLRGTAVSADVSELGMGGGPGSPAGRGSLEQRSSGIFDTKGRICLRGPGFKDALLLALKDEKGPWKQKAVLEAGELPMLPKNP